MKIFLIRKLKNADDLKKFDDFLIFSVEQKGEKISRRILNIVETISFNEVDL